MSATDVQGTRKSSPRRFIVDRNSQPFVVPDMDALLARLVRLGSRTIKFSEQPVVVQP